MLQKIKQIFYEVNDSERLHAVSLALFGLRTVVVAVLAWRVMPRQ